MITVRNFQLGHLDEFWGDSWEEFSTWIEHWETFWVSHHQELSTWLFKGILRWSLLFARNFEMDIKRNFDFGHCQSMRGIFNLNLLEEYLAIFNMVIERNLRWSLRRIFSWSMRGISTWSIRGIFNFISWSLRGFFSLPFMRNFEVVIERNFHLGTERNS